MLGELAGGGPRGASGSTGRPEDEMTAADAVVYGPACAPVNVITRSLPHFLPGAVTSNVAACAWWTKGADALVGHEAALSRDAGTGAPPPAQ